MPAGTITALRAQERDPQRVNVFIDGAFAIGVSLTTLTREGLFVGKPLDEAAWTRLEASESVDKAMQAGLRYLELRRRSTAEVRLRLQRKGFPPEAIAIVLARLTDLGLLDDAAFSRLWVESRQAGRPKGAIALRDELRRKGVDRATIEAAVAEQTSPDDERERAIALARGALHRHAGSDRVSFQRRLGGLLQRRGFAPDVTMAVVAMLWNEVQSSDDEAYDEDQGGLE